MGEEIYDPYKHIVSEQQRQEMKLLGCEEEGGVTQASLRNLEKFAKMHGRVRFLEHDRYSKEEHTSFYFVDGTVYVATGFSAGYAGEGPRGLMEAIRTHLARTDITFEHISAWKKGMMHLIIWGQGMGEVVMLYLGVMDCEYDLEVW